VEWNNFMPGVCGIFDNSGIPLIPAFTPGLITVYQKDQAVIAGNADICIGNTITLDAQGSTLTHSWTLPDQSNHSGAQLVISTASHSDEGYYLLNTLNSFGCSDTISQLVKVHDLPDVSISPSEFLCAELPHTLDPGNGFAEYLWQNGNAAQSQVTEGEGIYWVRVKDTYGCEASDSVTLVPCPAAFFIPSAFSPNRDGKNELFKIGYTDPDVPANYKLVIYSRWGQKIFESTEISEGWNGNFNGTICPSGVYTYVLYFTRPTGKTFSQESPLKGMITLIR
jgi:gliding motility-associated-like protein